MIRDLGLAGSLGTSILALAAAIAVLWRPVHAIRRFVKTVSLATRAIHGEPEDPLRPGSGTPGLLARVDAIGNQGVTTAAAVTVIQHEVSLNGGGSIKDSVRRLETATAAIGERMTSARVDQIEQAAEIKSDIAGLARRLDNHIDTGKESPH